jgi:hypothetical protein
MRYCYINHYDIVKSTMLIISRQSTQTVRDFDIADTNTYEIKQILGETTRVEGSDGFALACSVLRSETLRDSGMLDTDAGIVIWHSRLRPAMPDSQCDCRQNQTESFTYLYSCVSM